MPLEPREHWKWRLVGNAPIEVTGLARNALNPGVNYQLTGSRLVGISQKNRRDDAPGPVNPPTTQPRPRASICRLPSHVNSRPDPRTYGDARDRVHHRRSGIAIPG